MTDPRVAKLADLSSTTRWSSSRVRSSGSTAGPSRPRSCASCTGRRCEPAPIRARASRSRGLDVIAVGEASEEQLTFISEIDRFEIEKVDAIVTIWADRNTRALSQADPDAGEQEDRVAPAS